MSVDRTEEGGPPFPRLPGVRGRALVDSAWRDADVFEGGWIVSAAPARKQALTPGRTVAERYLVRRVLGEGGMGQVLEVEHVALGRAFALKVLRLERWNEELVRRFNREARALARLSTPRVAQVTDFGVDAEAGPFYVMELLEGETLEDRIQREGRLAPLEALAICAELCEALTEVHAASIVHRDLKPSNVGLPRSGPVGVKLLDFGLAAAMDDAFLSKITQSQQILGSLPYMAPEQFNAAEPAPAMDVYAVGVVLYEALAGRLPFLAPSTAAMIHQILATPPPPLPSDVAGREKLEPLLEQLLAKEPHERFASAAAAAHALRETAAAIAGPTRSVHPPTRVASDALPPTQEAKAVGSIEYLPTMAMPESRAVIESGMRLAGAATQGAPMAPSTPAASHPSTAHRTEPVSIPSAWPVRLLVVAALGVVLALLAAVGVVVVLSVLDGAPADETPPPPHQPPSPVPTPVVEAPPEPPRIAAPVIEGEPAREPVEAPSHEPERATPRDATPRDRTERPAPRRPEPVVERPVIQRPAVQPLPPPNPPPNSGSRGGIIRQW